LIATWQMEKRCQSPAGCMSSTSPVTARGRSPFFGKASEDDAVDLLHQFIGTKLLRAEHTGYQYPTPRKGKIGGGLI
jgi:hypothetical protein